MKNRLFLTLGGAIIIFLSIFVYLNDISPFFELSQNIENINYKLNNKYPSDKLLFVAVDEKSVNSFGRWPWKRSILAEGLKKLSTAKAVLLDMTFSEGSGKQEDKSLSNALFSLNNVVCGFFLRNKANEKLDAKRKAILSYSALSKIDTKKVLLSEASYAEASILPILQACTLNACFSTFPDKDGLFRRYPLGFVYDGLVYPSLGVQGLRLFLNKDLTLTGDSSSLTGKISDYKIKTDRSGFIRLNYYKPDRYNIVSFSDLIKGRVDTTEILDKIVIVGITEAGISDIRSTPIGAIPGPLLHYTFLSNMLAHHNLIEKKWITVLAIFMIGFIPIILSFYSRKILNRIFVNLTFGLIFTITAICLYKYNNIWIDFFFPLATLVLELFFCEAILFKQQEKESLFVKEAFSAYVSPVLLKKLSSNPDQLRLGGEGKELSVLFCDIRDFTTISEALESQELVHMLKELFNPLTKIIQDNEGYLDKYIGDAIMAFFNAPLDVENHAEYACKAALDMIKAVKSEELKSKIDIGFDLNIGVGINTGDCVVGNTGAHNRFNYTAIGDSVNLSSRLESLNKQYNTSILISEFTYENIKDKFLARKIESVFVKGKTKEVLVYELMEDTPLNRKIKNLFEKAVASGLKKDFEFCYEETGDKVSKIFIERFK